MKDAAAANRFLYNVKEVERYQKLNWYDYGARFYDPQLGRWIGVDPLSDEYLGLSPYNYCLDDPINLIDPDGMGPNENIYDHGNVLKDIIVTPNFWISFFEDLVYYTKMGIIINAAHISPKLNQIK